jgi:hypothetical protein
MPSAGALNGREGSDFADVDMDTIRHDGETDCPAPAFQMNISNNSGTFGYFALAVVFGAACSRSTTRSA